MRFGAHLVLAAVVMCLAACASVTSRAPVTAFENVTLISAYGERHREHQTVLVRGDRIVAVGRGVRVPVDARRIEGAGRFLAPGLTDMHVHIFEVDDGVLLLEWRDNRAQHGRAA